MKKISPNLRLCLGRVSLLFASIALCSSMLFAQSVVSGDLTGTVSDPSGAVVPSAQVQLKNTQTGESQETQTNASGAYRFSLLKPGAYSVTVNAPGLQAATQNANVNLGQVTRLDIKAGLAGTTTTVEVTAEAPLLQSDNANLSTTYNATQISSLPAPGGDTTSYAYTTPGITLSTGGGYGGFSSYGLPGNSNLFTVNGNDNMDPYLNLNNSGASNLTLGANELQEVAVVQNGYSVQYGRQAGAQENITTKSGTNQFHGNASYWYNSKMFNANDWFNNNSGTPTPHAVNNQYAASIGGPVIKDKLFFFADQEGLRYVLPGGGAPVYLPTAGFQSYVLGNLSNTNPSAIPFYNQIFSLYNGAPGGNRATPLTAADDPAMGCGNFTGGGFGTGGAPCSSVFRSTVNNLNTEWLLSTRVDWNINSTNTIFGRFRTDHGVQATGTDPINSAFNANSVQPEYEGQLNWTHVLGSTATNQFIASGSWYSAIFGPPDIKAALATFPTTLNFSNNSDGLLTDLGGTDFNFPQGRKVTQYQVVDDFSKTLGNHNFKIGVNFRRNNVSDFATGPLTSGLLNVGSFSDFANGVFNTGPSNSQLEQAFTNVNQVPIALYSLGVYAQDQWKPVSKLSLTAGLRVDRNSNPTCRTNCFSRPAGPFGNLPADATGATPYNAQIQTGLSNAFPDIEAVSIQPRLGVAYSVTPTTVIRTGIGLFTDLFPGTLIDRFLTNAPNEATFFTSSGFSGSLAPGTPNNAFTNLATSAAAFQAGFANGGSFSSLSATVPGFAAPSIATAAGKIANPKYVEYNFGVEQGVGKKGVASLNYVGNYGYDEFNVNRFPNSYCTSAANCAGFGLPTAPVNAGFGAVTELNNQSYSNYNGLTASTRWHISDRLQANVSYTWAKALDTCSNGCLLPFQFLTTTGVRNQLSPILPSTLNYGPADYDVRHSLNGNFVLSAPRSPFGNHLMNAVLGGWTWSETFYYHTGYPFSVVDNAVRTSGVSNIGTSVVLAQYLGGFAGGACTSPTNGCFASGQFVTDPSAQTGFGNLNRNSFRGPNYFDTDLNLTKNFRLTERFELGLGANAFNVLNHPNFDLPVNSVTSGNFGQIVSTVSPPTSPYGSFVGSTVSGRVIQLNAKVTF